MWHKDRLGSTPSTPSLRMPRMLGDEMDFRKLGVCGCGQVHRNELDVRVVSPKRQLQNPELLK